MSGHKRAGYFIFESELVQLLVHFVTSSIHPYVLIEHNTLKGTSYISRSLCVRCGFLQRNSKFEKMEFIQKIDFYHLLLKHPTLIKFSKNHKEPIRLKMTTISGTIRIFCLIQKFKRFRFCLFVQNRPVSSKTKILAEFRANSEIIGKFRKFKKFYGHFVKRQK